MLVAIKEADVTWQTGRKLHRPFHETRPGFQRRIIVLTRLRFNLFVLIAILAPALQGCGTTTTSSTSFGSPTGGTAVTRLDFVVLGDGKISSVTTKDVSASANSIPVVSTVSFAPSGKGNVKSPSGSVIASFTYTGVTSSTPPPTTPPTTPNSLTGVSGLTNAIPQGSIIEVTSTSISDNATVNLTSANGLKTFLLVQSQNASSNLFDFALVNPFNLKSPPQLVINATSSGYVQVSPQAQQNPYFDAALTPGSNFIKDSQGNTVLTKYDATDIVSAGTLDLNNPPAGINYQKNLSYLNAVLGKFDIASYTYSPPTKIYKNQLSTTDVSLHPALDYIGITAIPDDQTKPAQTILIHLNLTVSIQPLNAVTYGNTTAQPNLNTIQFTASVPGDGINAVGSQVTWSSSPTSGLIDPNTGVFTAPVIPTDTTYTITAVSKVQPDKAASTTITVKANSGTINFQ